jgi:SAM-dependent methyltransferase
MPRPLPPWLDWKDVRAVPELRGFSRDQLLDALAERVRDDATLPTQNTALDRLRQFAEMLQAEIDCHENRYSRQRYFDTFQSVAGYIPNLRDVVRAGMFVDVGCGSWNPFALSAMFLASGARRSLALDLDPPASPVRATRAVAEVWGMLLLDPASLLGGSLLARDELHRNVADFDITALLRGDVQALEGSRLGHHLGDAAAMPLPDGAASLASSNAFLEHVADPLAVAKELYRISPRGGYQVHVVDATDHRRYTDPQFGPLDHLTEDGHRRDMTYTVAGITYQMNGLRPRQFGGVFEQAGFRVVSYQGFHAVEPPPGKKLAAPFRDLDPATLREGMARLVLTRN